MKQRRGQHLPIVTALLLWLLHAPVSQSEAIAQNQAIVLIAHPSVEEGSIHQDRLRAIFAMRETRWADGSPIRVVVLPDQDPIHRDFCKSPLSIYPFILRRHWDRLTFTGTGPMPIQVNNESEMLKKVSQTPGALGYLRQSAALTNVKRIMITQGRRDQGDSRP